MQLQPKVWKKQSGKIDILLYETIDKLVKPWEFKEHDFYKAYNNARIIVDAGYRKRKKVDIPLEVNGEE